MTMFIGYRDMTHQVQYVSGLALCALGRFVCCVNLMYIVYSVCMYIVQYVV